MEKNNIHKDFLDKVHYFVNSPVDELIQNRKNSAQGVLIFNALKSDFITFQKILSYISEDIVLSLPEFKIAELKQRLNQLFEVVDIIQNLQKNPSQSDVNQTQSIIQPFIGPFNYSNPNSSGYFAREKDAVWGIITQAISLFLNKDENKKKISDAISSLENFENLAKKKYESLNDLLISAKSEISKSGVEVHSKIFLNQADKHFDNSKDWRTYSIWALTSTIAISLIFFFIIVFAVDDSRKIIETGILAALIISMFTYASTLAVKNYFAEKHNESINRHKANCLSTFNTFIDSADSERKAAVLLQATQTIFSHQSSGFLSKEIDINNPNPIVEVVRNITGKTNSLN